MSVTLPLATQSAGQGGFAALLQELQPRPGRLADTMRLVVVVLATVAIGETFRMPEIAVSAYVVLFVSRDERSSTVMTALVGGTAIVFAVFATIVLFMASLSEPALRVPLIALATFAALFLSRISPLGSAAFAVGFIMAYGLTIGDQGLGLAWQASEIGNTTEPGAPELLSLPPEEALLHFVLWLAPVVALPVALVVVANLLTGRQPIQVLCTGLADRIGACAAFCAGEPGGTKALAASARAGSAGLSKLLHAAGVVPRAPDYASLITATQQLALALLAWPMVAPQASLQPLAAGLRAAERRLRSSAEPIVATPPVLEATSDAARPLAAEIAGSAAAIQDALGRPPAVAAKPPHAAGHLIVPGAARNPETLRFALKVTLAVMLSYAAESLLDWPAIHTCVVTCFFVSLGTVGESLHKATLRIVGAMIGGALGIASILLLMPLMTDLGDLLLALGAVTLLAGWVACGSERISYAGWQIGLAYYLTILQGYGPTLDMQTARDRVIGIVLGNIIVLVVFTTIWPVSVTQAARRQLATAISQMAALMRLGPQDEAARRRTLRTGFATASNGARALMANTDFGLATVWHDGPRPIGPGTVADLETVMLVLCVISDLPSDPAASTYDEAIATWFDRCAAWVRSGTDAGSLEADIPAPPKLDDPALATQAAWYGILDRELRTIMARIMHGVDADG